jgi:hypothetical protein
MEKWKTDCLFKEWLEKRNKELIHRLRIAKIKRAIVRRKADGKERTK